MLPSGATSDIAPSSGRSLIIMTRSGAPFQGAAGEGRTWISAVSHAPDAAFAGESMVVNRKAAVAAEAKWRARRILTTFLQEAGTALGPADPMCEWRGPRLAPRPPPRS